jgi:hypothetical protein
MQRYPVQLTSAERTELEHLIRAGHAAARHISRAQILLNADAGQPRQQISGLLHVAYSTVTRVCRDFQRLRLDVLTHKSPMRAYPRCLDGGTEAHLIALACSSPPAGRVRWTLRLLQTELVRSGQVVQVSHETIRTTLKKTL